MAKYWERIKARELRRCGESIGDIRRKLGVAKSSVSVWCRDIVLTDEQVEKLVEKDRKAGAYARMRAAESLRMERVKREAELRRCGEDKVEQISEKGLLEIGLSMYWAEGSKKDRIVSLINSDPLIIQLFIRWLQVCFGVRRERLIAVISINESHTSRLVEVQQYWMLMTGLEESQFRKPSLKKVKNKKIYANFNDHYGSLVIKVSRSTNLFYEILGCIAGLKKWVAVEYQSRRQGSSAG